MFKNVVENLRVKASARTLSAKWRAMTADKRSDVDNDIKIRSSTSIEISGDDDDESYSKDDLAVIAELLRAKHGADIKLSRAECESKKADEYLQRQKEHLVAICEADVGDEKDPIQRDFETFTYQDCLTLNPTIIAEEPTEDIGEVSQLSKARHEKFNKLNTESEEKVTLTDNQNRVVGRMKQFIENGQMFKAYLVPARRLMLRSLL